MTEPWWRSAIVYEVYPRSFGDLREIAARLDHVEWLGADAVWLAPIYASPGHRVSLETAASLVLQCTRGYRLPEPTHLADRLAGRRGAGPA